jgi:hypothetical protein
MMILAGGLLAVASGIWGWMQRPATSPAGPLSISDKAAIRRLVEQQTTMPIRSMTPMPGGTVSVFAAGDELGRMQFDAIQVDGEWRLSGETLFY